MTIQRLFSAHPASVGESYGEHLGQALRFSFYMGLGCIACCIHAFLPFLFEKTGSSLIARLHDRMITHRDRRSSLTPAAE